MAYVRAANASPNLSVLIRDGEHDNTNSKQATELKLQFKFRFQAVLQNF